MHMACNRNSHTRKACSTHAHSNHTRGRLSDQHWRWVQIQGHLDRQISCHSSHNIRMVCSNLCILPSVHTHNSRTRGQLRHQHWGQRQGLHQQISFRSSHNIRMVCSNL